ncbi:hypothetical protein [Bacillus cereus group sp. BfR-BA-01380]|uniref:hypothetical protein n=1 Tax=Bacillus cereus group sp. BfR-BA-01380 TaxID=2920324 RepID=UPI001F5764AF|nr:hypothetical protein [Bacillus cereus group sp. BfR-BA-01380]
MEMEMVVGIMFFILLFAIIVKANASSGRKRGRNRYNSGSTDSTGYSAPIFFADSSDSSGDCGGSFGGDGGSCGGGDGGGGD